MSLLEVENVTKRFGGIAAVNSCSLEVQQNTILGLIGPNGSGKTTMFNLITGFLQPDGGDIRFKGRRINGLKPHDIARLGIGRTFQRIGIFPKMTTLQNMLLCRLTNSLQNCIWGSVPATMKAPRWVNITLYPSSAESCSQA